MSFLTFLDDELSHWGDDDRRQRHDINDARRGIESVSAQVEAQNQQQSQEIQALRRNVAKLAATVDELIMILVERGALDDAATRSRLADVMRAKVTAAAPGATAAGQQAKPQATVRCVKCGTSIPLAYSNMTEHGATCDRCV